MENETPKTPAELAAELQETIKAKAEELTRREGVTVTPILFYYNANTSDPVIGYLKAPTRLAKIRIMDKSEQIGNYSAAAELIEICLLKADSDARIYSDAQEYDDLYMGAVLACQALISASINQIKKN